VHQCLLGISSLGEGVSFDPWLLLVHRLRAPLEATLLETPVNTDGHAIRDTFGDVDNFLNTNLSEGRSDDVRRETEVSLGDLASTGIFVVESGDERERLTPEVDLIVNRTLGKEGALTWAQFVDNKASSVLLDEPSFHLAVNVEKDLGCSGMGVGGVHSARCHLSDGHGYAIREERREVSDV